MCERERERVCVRERESVCERDMSLFASLSRLIMFIVIPAPWNFDQSEDRLLARDLY